MDKTLEARLIGTDNVVFEYAILCAYDVLCMLHI